MAFFERELQLEGPFLTSIIIGGINVMILMIHAYVSCSQYVLIDFVRFMMYQCDSFIMIELYHYTLY